MLNLALAFLGIATSVAILSFLKNRLAFELQATSLLLFGSPRPGIIFYATIMLPGTILHELSHWLVAEILRAPTGKITILPDTKEQQPKLDTQKLGSVEVADVDPFRNFLIGLAPLVTGIFALVVMSRLIIDWWAVRPFWQIMLLVYGLVVISNSMLVSASDRKNWGITISFILILSFILWQVGFRLTEELVTNLTNILIFLTKILGLTIVLNLVTIGLSKILRRLIERLSRKKVMFNR